MNLQGRLRTLAALNSKGGVGKTTLLANLGGLFADMGARTLLVDADPQPSLTKYYDIPYEAPHGLVEVITSGILLQRMSPGPIRPVMDQLSVVESGAAALFAAEPERWRRMLEVNQAAS